MKIFATGLSGFIGRPIAPLLNERYEVHALTRRTPKERQGIFWHEGDLFDGKFRQALLRDVRPDLLLHLAWDVAPGYQTSERNYEWLWASFNLFREFIQAGGRRAVFAGTCFEYDWSYERCEEDATPLRPGTTYGVCKNALRELVENHARGKDAGWAWGRIFYPFGEGERPERFFPSLIRAASRKEPVTVNTGQQVRDFIYVMDAASAFCTLLETDVCGVFNVGSGVPCSRRRVAETICDMMDCREQLEVKTLVSEEPDSFFADVRKLNDLGWRARYSLREALEEMVARGGKGREEDGGFKRNSG
jgi:nucleoside-diphosphate-sugar epimerase